MAKENVSIVLTAIDKTRNAFRTVAGGLNKIKGAIFNVKTGISALAGATGFALLIKSTISTNKEFQSLEATLKTFLGSSQRASDAFNVLKQFAAQTPFSVQEVTKSFNILIAQGITPSIKALDAFGNIASGSGKSLQQFSEAVTDAVQGEFERLKEFGIKASKEGDRITFTFGGVQTEVKNTAEEVQGFLVQLGQTKFAGATAEQAKTLSGAFSNLGDAFDAFATAIGEAGFNKSINDFSRTLSALVRNSPQLAEAIGQKLAGAVNFLTGILKQGEGGVTAFAASLSIKVLEAVQGTLMSLQSLTEGVDKTIRFLTFGLQGAGTLDFSNQVQQLDLLKEKLRSVAETAGMDGGGAALTIDQLNEKLGNVLEGVGGTNEALSAGQQALKDYASSADDVKANLEGAALKGVQSLEDGLLGIMTGSMKAKDAFKSMAQSIIADLARIFIQKNITGSIAGAFGNFFGGKTAAIGGSVQRGQPVLVGERGREVFVSNSSGSIVPNNKLGGSSVTINQTINVATGVQQTVRTEIASLMPQIAEATKTAVADARMRGGTFSKAFG